MLPSSRDPERSEHSSHSTSPSSQTPDLSHIDTEQMFRLIDNILPFEACLYYRFLPLALEGKYIKLGMVDPQDSSALDYVRRILAYMNCSLKTKQITPQTHKSMLSAYLNHIHTTSSQKPAPKNKNKPPRTEQPTLILDESALEDELGQTADAPSPTPAAPLLPEPTPPSSEPNPPVPSNPTSQDISKDTFPERPVTPLERPLPSTQATLPLEVQALYLSHPIEFLATLDPHQLLQELLGRVLVGGIGRLYFERRADHARILWSRDGVLKSVLEGLSLSAFEGVILELKRFVNLPLLPVIQPKQVEIERVYQQECLLLRLRVMPGSHGEEATLQVLRGVALKFYQRKKLDKLGQEALMLANQLQYKLNEIRDRSSRYSLPIEVPPALHQLLSSLENHREALTRLPVNQHSDP